MLITKGKGAICTKGGEKNITTSSLKNWNSAEVMSAKEQGRWLQSGGDSNPGSCTRDRQSQEHRGSSLGDSAVCLTGHEL